MCNVFKMIIVLVFLVGCEAQNKVAEVTSAKKSEALQQEEVQPQTQEPQVVLKTLNKDEVVRQFCAFQVNCAPKNSADVEPLTENSCLAFFASVLKAFDVCNHSAAVVDAYVQVLECASHSTCQEISDNKVPQSCQQLDSAFRAAKNQGGENCQAIDD